MNDDDLKNKTISINDNQENKTSSIGNEGQGKNEDGLFDKFKNFIKDKMSSNDKDKQNQDESTKNDSDKETKSSLFSTEEKKHETLKDKVENKFINLFNVERSIGTFCILMSIGSLFIILSFFLLPLVIVSPKKFSLCFAVGSIFVLISFLFLVGSRSFVTKLFEQKRLLISIMFILSIFFGVGFSLGNHYFLSMICSVIQLFGLIMFMLTFIPGGQFGIQCIKNLITSPFSKLFINKAKSDLESL